MCKLNIFQVLNRVVNYFILIYMLNLYFILEVSTGPKFPARPANVLFGQARLGINILQNFAQQFNYFLWGGGQKLMKILLSSGIICDLISVQLQTCGILKTKYYFYFCHVKIKAKCHNFLVKVSQMTLVPQFKVHGINITRKISPTCIGVA